MSWPAPLRAGTQSVTRSLVHAPASAPADDFGCLRRVAVGLSVAFGVAAVLAAWLGALLETAWCVPEALLALAAARVMQPRPFRWERDVPLGLLVASCFGLAVVHGMFGAIPVSAVCSLAALGTAAGWLAGDRPCRAAPVPRRDRTGELLG